MSNEVDKKATTAVQKALDQRNMTNELLEQILGALNQWGREISDKLDKPGPPGPPK